MPVFQPTDDNLKKAKMILEKGGIIAYPTETFYALGVNPFNTDALKKLFKIKGRSTDKPVSILIRNENELNDIVEDIPDIAKGIIKRFWPGPLTIVFKAKGNIHDMLTAFTGKIAVRVSSNPIAKRLLDILEMPITTTSANPSGGKSPVNAEDVERYFGSRLDMIIDGGVMAGKLGSTIVDVTDKHLRCVREGDIPFKSLELYK